MAIEGTVKTPLGEMKKQTALIAGGFIVVLGGIVYYRHKRAAAATPAVSTDGEIDPATGYAYGSPEDLAALQAQGNTAMPVSNSGGGSSASSDTPVHPTTNDQWTQRVLADLQANNLSDSVANMSTALGKYLTGAYVTDNDVALIQQAIALEGSPPVAGATGYPPALNRNPPQTQGLPMVSGLRITSHTATSVHLGWEPVAGASNYTVRWANKTVSTAATAASIGQLQPGGGYSFYVKANDAHGQSGPETHVTIVLPKK